MRSPTIRMPQLAKFINASSRIRARFHPKDLLLLEIKISKKKRNLGPSQDHLGALDTLRDKAPRLRRRSHGKPAKIAPCEGQRGVNLNYPRIWEVWVDPWPGAPPARTTWIPVRGDGGSHHPEAESHSAPVQALRAEKPRLCDLTLERSRVEAGADFHPAAPQGSTSNKETYVRLACPYRPASV
jgi:hypothetical protein